jgi:hypothetical protein
MRVQMSIMEAQGQQETTLDYEIEGVKVGQCRHMYFTCQQRWQFFDYTYTFHLHYPQCCAIQMPSMWSLCSC